MHPNPLFNDYLKLDKDLKNYIKNFEGAYASTIDYANLEYGRGAKYTQEYIERLGLSGEKVLDAGCGVGNWTIALSKFFKEVYALEFSEDRLNFSKNIFSHLKIKNIKCIKGSIEDLPFDDNTFDAVFCNGVIFLTDFKESLKEFFRVLKPGGKLYLNYDGLNWWDHLIFDRGPNNPAMFSMASQMLLNYIKLTLRDDLNNISKNYKFFTLGCLIKILIFSKGTIEKIFYLYQITRMLLKLRNHSSENQHNIDLAFFINKISSLSHALSRVFEYGTKIQKRDALKQFQLWINDKKSCEIIRGTSIDINDMEDALGEVGFVSPISSSEGLLIFNPLKNVKPIYDLNHGVYETITSKPRNFNAHFFDEEIKYQLINFSLEESLYNIIPKDALQISLSDYLKGKFPEKSYGLDVLRKLTNQITQGCNTENERFFAIYKYLQNRFFHHPTFQLMDSPSKITASYMPLLLTGIGRCGAVAQVAKILYEVLGYEARVTQLYKHVCCEVSYMGKWRAIDPDMFKGGVYPKNRNGEWADLTELEKEPSLLDELPMTGYQLSSTGPWAKNILGEPIQGYVDTGLSWDRPYASFYYFGNNALIPPLPPKLIIKRLNSKKIQIDLCDIDLKSKIINIKISKDSRGWSYNQIPSELYHRKPKEIIKSIEVEVTKGNTYELDLAPGVYYINVYALDEYAIKNRNIYVWPSDEIIFQG